MTRQTNLRMIRLRKGVYRDPIGGEVWHNVHARSDCAGRKCVVHNPSIHGMVCWRRHLRETGLVERICPTCGCGHPDPDSLAYFKTLGIDNSVHGCCGHGHGQTGEELS